MSERSEHGEPRTQQESRQARTPLPGTRGGPPPGGPGAPRAGASRPGPGGAVPSRGAAAPGARSAAGGGGGGGGGGGEPEGVRRADPAAGDGPAGGGGAAEDGPRDGRAPAADEPAAADGPRDADDRARHVAAWRASTRVLWRSSAERTVREGLTALAAGAAEVYAMDSPVDLYGDGPVAELERRTAALLGFPAAVHFPTGTMAQQVALRCWAGRTGNRTVALHPLSHPEVHERSALSVVGGLRTVHPTHEPRLPSAEEVQELEEPFGTLMLELPLRDAGFVLPEWDDLVATVGAARERDAVVHVDGARLWECGTHFGRPLDEIAGLADSVYVSFYKSLGGLSGAVLAGPHSLVEEARAWRHRYGGQVFQQYPAALSGLVGLERELPRLPSYVAHARTVAAALGEGLAAAGVPWHRVNPPVPQTHQFQVWLPVEADAANAAALAQSEETGVTLFRRWFPDGPPGMCRTEVTVSAEGLRWSAGDVGEAAADFARRLP
ncbi:beta-eliminating lyase-related protein [Streptomyces sp. NPDC047968]|uniref:threonine aldolase family protein n=3 Tax=Streptomyces TaxID=1883 RepID=UPI003425BFD9